MPRTNSSDTAGDTEHGRRGTPAEIPFVPSVPTDWDGDVDPGNVQEALDQVAERTDDLENDVVDASDVTYTPAVDADWDGDADPGDVDDALDQLAERVDDNEAAIAGITVDASDVTYTPAVDADWDGDADPGDLDDALDQLAERVDDNEAAVAGAGDVTAAAVLNNLMLVKGDVAAKAVRTTGISVDINNNVRMPTTSKVEFNNAIAYIYSNAASELTIYALVLTTIGFAGNTEFGDGTLRTVKPNTDIKVDLGDSTHRFNDVWAAGGIRTEYVTDNIAGAEPTDAELDTAFGTPAAQGAGYVGVLDDNGAGTAVFLCASDGTNWWHSAMTKAV